MGPIESLVMPVNPKLTPAIDLAATILGEAIKTSKVSTFDAKGWESIYNALSPANKARLKRQAPHVFHGVRAKAGLEPLK